MSVLGIVRTLGTSLVSVGSSGAGVPGVPVLACDGGRFGAHAFGGASQSQTISPEESVLAVALGTA